MRPTKHTVGVVLAAAVLCAVSVSAQTTAASRYTANRMLVGIGIGGWSEPWSSTVGEKGHLTTATARFQAAPRWALESSLSKAGIGWSFGGTAQYRISTADAIAWCVGIGPLVTPGSGTGLDRAKTVMTQALTTAEVPVTGRIAPYVTLQVNFRGSYATMWIVGGVRVGVVR